MSFDGAKSEKPADLFRRLVEFIETREFGPERINALSALLDEAVERPLAERVEIARRLGERGDRDFVRLHSILGRLTGDPYEYQAILNWLTLVSGQIEPAVAHYVYWGVQSRVFAGALRGPKAAGFAECDLYRYHQSFIRTIKERFALRPTRRVARPGPIRRIAVVTNQFLSDRHQPTRDVFDYAWRLRAELGIDAAIVNTGLLPRRVGALFFPPFIASGADAFEGERRLRMWDREVPVVSFTAPDFDQAKLRSIVDWIDGFDPDAIVAFGGTNIAADLFAGARPTVCLPTTSHVTLTLADLLLGYDGSDWTTSLHDLYREPFARRFRAFTLGFAIPPTDPERAGDFGLGDASSVFLVVGTRLDAEVDRAFLDLLDRALDAAPGAVLRFAGAAPGLADRVAGARNAARMGLLGHVEDIRALYRRRAVFLNPRRQGGGGSAGFALAEGVPVVTFPGGDVGGVAGEGFHVATDEAFVAAAARLALDPASWDRSSAIARARYAEIGDRSRFAKRLLDLCEEARGPYREG